MDTSSPQYETAMALARKRARLEVPAFPDSHTVANSKHSSFSSSISCFHNHFQRLTPLFMERRSTASSGRLVTLHKTQTRRTPMKRSSRLRSPTTLSRCKLLLIRSILCYRCMMCIWPLSSLCFAVFMTVPLVTRSEVST